MGRKKKRKNPQPAAPMPVAPPTNRRLGVAALVVAVVAIALIAIVLLRDRGRENGQLAIVPTPERPQRVDWKEQALAEYGGSDSCRECHAAGHEDWVISHHALAERQVSEPLDNPPLDEHPELRDPKRIIGYDPLQQFLIAFEGGRFQAADTAYDPRQRDWFNVFGEDRREPGEWGHWTGRGMNWNSMCAACHNTRLFKNYDRATDTYDTKMAQMSVSCESCHGPMKDHVDWQRRYGGERDQWGAPLRDDPTLRRMSRDAMFDTCGSCHARRGELTGDFIPGDSFHDHFRLRIVDETDTFYPDGQVRDEDFEYAPFLGSRMHAAGIRCADCHHPHTAKPVAAGDFMCMRCHQGTETYPTAAVIRPQEHVFHQSDSPGARCVNCHMPQTTYMQRHVRHDHGFTVPDPLLTIEHDIPNACNRCHTDMSPQWALAMVEQWYGEKMDRPSRRRTQVIARAREGDDAAVKPLIELLRDAKETPYWKAVAAGMLARWVGDPAVAAALLEQLAHEDALVRAEAARALEPLVEPRPEVRAAMEKLLNDPRRNVRLAAAWALRSTIEPSSPAGQELLHLLETSADQPLGRVQSAHYQLARGDLASALRELATAVRWDPTSGDLRQEMAILYSMSSDPAEAVRELREAIRLSPQAAEPRYLLGLALHESGDMAGVVRELQEAVRLDPGHARAWYNLGLAQHAMGQSEAGLDSLRRGEAADPADPRIPYARATILLQLNRRAEAMEAARRALQIRPDYTPAMQLLSQPSGQTR